MGFISRLVLQELIEKLKVPFFSIKLAPDSLRRDWIESISAVIESGVFVNGESVTNFENEFAEILNCSHAIGVSNGLDGLVVALMALKIGEGDFVAVPAHTFIATWTAVLRVGATPIGIDVDKYGLLDIECLRINQNKFKAVIPVHMHGSMVDMKRLLEFTNERKMYVIEDASQAHFASLDSKMSGTWGDVGVFSLYPTKNLGALGDAGVVVTNNSDLAATMRSLINYGSKFNDKYNHEILGFNNRLDAMQAAVLSKNLKFHGLWTERRREIAAKYYKSLGENNISFITENIEESVFHHFPILVENRDRLRSKLLNSGIGTEIHYPYPAALEVSKLLCENYVGFSNAEKISNKSLSLPISQWHSDSQIEFVIDTLKKLFSEISYI